jgi:single-strand DNA-binding protein
MASFNQVNLMGNITRDIELRYIPSGKAVTDISLAINEPYKKESGERVDKVTFIDVQIWGKQAENLAEYSGKGYPVFVSGRLKRESWLDKKTEEKKSKIIVIADRIQFLNPRTRNNEQPQSGNYQQNNNQNQQSRLDGSYSDSDSVPF